MPLEIKNPGLMPGGLMPGVHVGERDADGRVNWISPNQGRYLVSHVDLYLNRYTSLASVYRSSDAAVNDSRANARAMRNDLGIRECIDSRQRSVALLDWHIEPESKKALASHTEFCAFLESCVRRIRNFTQYRYTCQHAIFYGKYGIQHRWRPQTVNGKSVYLPTGVHQDDWGWKPIHGDKLVFRQLVPGREMPPGGYEGQLGLRVGNTFTIGQTIQGRWKVQPTDYGLGYFLSPAERRLMLVHKHQVEDAAYEDGINAGSVYGVGIRSVIYWEWVQKQETMAFLMQFLERMAGGIQVWKYPQGNTQAEAATKAAAQNYNSGQQHVLVVPVPVGDPGQYDIDIHEPGFGGIDVIQNLIHGYFEHRIKRYILGQILSSESEATGLGSGVADLHHDTLLQILRYDATNLEETLTYDLLDAIIKINVQAKLIPEPGFMPRFVLQTENPDVDKLLEAWTSLIDRGLRFREADLYDLVGASMPGANDKCLDPPQKGQGGPEGGAPPAKPMANPEADASRHAPPRVPNDETDDAIASATPARYGRNGFTTDALLKGIRTHVVTRANNGTSSGGNGSGMRK